MNFVTKSDQQTVRANVRYKHRDTHVIRL